MNDDTKHFFLFKEDDKVKENREKPWLSCQSLTKINEWDSRLCL